MGKRIAAVSSPSVRSKSTFALVDVELAEWVKQGGFQSPFVDVHSVLSLVQPASLDVPIGSRCILLREKVLPFRKRVEQVLKEEDLILEERDFGQDQNSILLLKGQTYLFPCGRVTLKDNQYGTLSPKSSIGRVDLMVRGIVDECGLYDTVDGKGGELWMEVSPRSFNVRLHAGQALSQLMVFETRQVEKPIPQPLSFAVEQEGGEEREREEKVKLSFDQEGQLLPLHVHRGALVLSLNLSTGQPTKTLGGDQAFLVGYEALPTSAIVDLGQVRAHDPQQFFRPLMRDAKCSSITLEKDKFYILSTKERIRIPLEYSAEMVPFSQHVGELRAHYAGFFDPGFGYGRQGEVKGTVGVLEVRPHETITVYDGQPICLMEFYNNSVLPSKPYGLAGNNYHAQSGPQLAKYFASS